jgi:hypothetical protein
VQSARKYLDQRGTVDLLTTSSRYAGQILRLLGIAGERCPDLLRFWIVIFYS